MKDYHEQNYYELLDVGKNANQEEILLAYKRARATYSGNSPALYSLFDKSEAEELLKLIDEAYAVLSNQFKRKEYDKSSSPIRDGRAETSTPKEEVKNQMQPQPHVDKAKHKTLTAAEEQKEFEKTFTAIQGVKGVLIKNNPSTKSAPGFSKFGKFEYDQAFENEILDAENFPGAFLQKIRIYKNITLDQISEVTKISRAYLAAIENDDYACLPAVVFLRGFLVQLAKFLEIDSQKVAASYIKIMSERKKR